MKKTVLLFVLTIIFFLPQQIKAQIDTDSAYKIVGSAIGREIRKSYDQAVSKRKAEKAEQERKEQEYWENYPKMKREEKRAEEAAREKEKNRNQERIISLNAEDDRYKKDFENGNESYNTYNRRIGSHKRQLEYYNYPNNNNNRITVFSEVDEPLVFEIGCVDDNYNLGLIVVSGADGPIKNKQVISFSSRMEFYGSWADEYRYIDDIGTITIPANTNVYRIRLSKVFPKYSSRLRILEMTDADDLKIWQAQKMTMSLNYLTITTKVSNKNVKLNSYSNSTTLQKVTFENYDFEDDGSSGISVFQETPMISTPSPVFDLPGRWAVFYTNDGNMIKLWINNGHLYYLNTDNKERRLVCNKAVGWVEYYGVSEWVKYEDAFSMVLYPQRITKVDYNEFFPNNLIKGNIKSIEIQFFDGVYIK